MSTKTVKLKAQPERFRSAPARGIAGGEASIDREAGVIRGYSVARLGVTVDKRFEFDEETLGQIVQLGNAAGKGVKSRFTHPSMSNDGMGKFLGRSKNFRRDGDAIRADLHVSQTAYDTPSGDLASYVMDLAEEDPSAFGASVVVEADSKYRVNDKNERLTDKAGNPLPPLLRAKRLFASDVVDDPAVDQGFFGNALSDPARFATELLDEHFDGASPEVIRARAETFINHYLEHKGFAMATEATKDTKDTQPADTQPAEREQPTADLAAEREKLAKEWAEFEKQKARLGEEKEIRELCAAVGSEAKQAEKFCAAGLSLAEVKDELLAARKKEFALRGDPGDRDVPEKSDPEGKAKADYAAEKDHYELMGISEADYLYSAKVDAANGVLAAVK